MPKLLRPLSTAFLTALLCLLFVQTFAVQGLAAQTPTRQTLKDRKGKPLQIGLQLYSVRDDCAKDLPGLLSAVAKMGYTGVEFAGYHGRSAAELRRMLDENKLKCYGTHLDLNALLGDNFDKTVEFCRVLGCKFLVVPWLPVERRNSKQTILETAQLFGEIAKKLELHGMLLGWHNEDYEWQQVDGETIWETFWSHADKRVAMQFDTGNAMEAGVQAAPFLEKYPYRVLSVHVKDHSSTNKSALLGEGDEHWNEVIPLLKGNPAIRWFIIEQESYGAPPLVCVEKCLRNFEQLWNAGKLTTTAGLQR
jgi:sugar phosphate isomerase/epimerase